MTHEIPQKLYDAISNMGLTFLECHKLIEISEEIETAAWCFNTETREERVLFNPVFMDSLDAIGCEVVLYHEILHKALYKGFAREDLDHQLLNIALDAAVNRVLSRSYPHEVFKAFCDGLYGRHPENTQTPLAIIWYGLDPNRIQIESLRNYYIKFWDSKEDPSPLEVYYQLLELSQEDQSEGDGEGEGRGAERADSDSVQATEGDVEGGEKSEQRRSIRRISTDDLVDLPPDKIGDKVLRGTSTAGISSGPGFEDWVKRMTLLQEEFEVRSIEDFLHRIESVELLDRTADRIVRSLKRETRRLTYPLYPSRLGHVYILTGLSDRLRQYWNLLPSNRLPRLNIYVDVSPSMSGFREKEVFLINRLKDFFPTTFYVFGGRVQEFTVADFAKGEYPIAYSTDFNPVVKHLMGSDVECGVVFTDGFSNVSLENRLRFPRSGKRLYAVYFNDDERHRKDGPNPVQSNLDEISDEVMQIDLFDEQPSLSHRVVLQLRE